MPIQKTIGSRYGSVPVRLELQLNKSKQLPLVIFFHGCCGTAFDAKPTTYQQLAAFLQEKRAFHTVIYESSRNVLKSDVKITGEADFQRFTHEAFGDKKFKDEIAEAKAVIKAILLEIENNRVQTKEVVLVGFSLGGLIATVVSQIIKPQALCLFGSGTHFNVDPRLPILGGGLSAADNRSIRTAARLYEGSVNICWGSEDNTTDKQAALDLFAEFENASRRSFAEWKGFDHRFILNHGQIDGTIISQLAQFVINSIAK